MANQICGWSDICQIKGNFYNPHWYYMYMQLCQTRKQWIARAKDVELTNEGRYKLHNQMHKGNIVESISTRGY